MNNIGDDEAIINSIIENQNMTNNEVINIVMFRAEGLLA